MTETSDEAPSPTLSPHKSASMVEDSVGTDQTPEGEEAEGRAPAHLDQLKRFEQQMTLLLRKQLSEKGDLPNSSLRASGSGTFQSRVDGKLKGHIAKSLKEHRIRSRLTDQVKKNMSLRTTSRTRTKHLVGVPPGSPEQFTSGIREIEMHQPVKVAANDSINP
jgi:hypothetical protein